MFKGKKSLYFLIPVNLFIWSYAGIKIYNAFSEDEDILPYEHTVSVAKLKKEDSVVYKLALNYPDPFLKKEAQYKSNTSSNAGSSAPKSRPVSVVPKTVVTPPKTIDIKYLGLVENKTSGAATGLISINGKSYLVKKGEVVDGVLIKSISSEKLEAKIGKEVISVQK
jgi:hypothetical protein